MQPIYAYDTYATTEKGRILHFNVVIPARDQNQALVYARTWLKEIGEGNALVKAESCCYCHSEPTAPVEMAREIETKGFAIFKLEGCPR